MGGTLKLNAHILSLVVANAGGHTNTILVSCSNTLQLTH